MCSPLWARHCSPKGGPRDGTRVTRPPLTLTLSLLRALQCAHSRASMPLMTQRVRHDRRPPALAGVPPVFPPAFLLFSSCFPPAFHLRIVRRMVAAPGSENSVGENFKISTNELLKAGITSKHQEVGIGQRLGFSRPGPPCRKRKISTTEMMKAGIASENQVFGKGRKRSVPILWSTACSSFPSRASARPLADTRHRIRTLGG